MDIRENFYNRLHEARNPELKKLIRNYAGHKAAAYDSGDSGDDESMDHHEDEAKKILKVIKKNHGHEAANHAEMSADSNIFGTERKRARRPDSLEGGLRANFRKDLTKKGVIPKNTQKAMQGVAASGEGKLKRKISKPKGIIPEETLNELRGKSSLSDDERKELKDRIRKKHGKAWNDTIDIRKEKKSSGPADTRDMDKLRDRLARMYNKLEEEQLDELKGYQGREGQKRLGKLFKRANKRAADAAWKDPKTAKRNSETAANAWDRFDEKNK